MSNTGLNLEYIPGICNIGTEERALRRRSGYISLLVLIVLVLILSTLHSYKLLNLLFFFPTFFSTIAFLQYRMHFCAAFGFGSMYNFGKIVLKPSKIERMEYVKKDRNKAFKIILYSLIISVFITSILYIII